MRRHCLYGSLARSRKYLGSYAYTYGSSCFNLAPSKFLCALEIRFCISDDNIPQHQYAYICTDIHPDCCRSHPTSSLQELRVRAAIELITPAVLLRDAPPHACAFLVALTMMSQLRSDASVCC